MGNGKSEGQEEPAVSVGSLAPWPHCHGHKNVQSILYGSTFTHTLAQLIISEGMEMVLMHRAARKKRRKMLMETIFLLSGLLDFTFYLLALLFVTGQQFHICFYCTQVGA